MHEKDIELIQNSLNSLNQIGAIPSEEDASVGEEGGIVKECPQSSDITNMRNM